MKQTLFYQSSLPRAGSTLLQNIMGQNPLFYVTPTSGLVDLIMGTKLGYEGNKESKAGDLDMWKKGFHAFCREGVKGYIQNLTDKPYIIDKSRAWGPYYSLLNRINPNPKILFMVRDLRAIFASMEKKFRNNPEVDSQMIDNTLLKNITTIQRIKTWANNHPVGYALEKLNQSFLDKTAHNFLFIRYEDLCTQPEQQLRVIYGYLGIEYYQHNFEHIPQITVEDDTVHGIYGDHIIRNTLEMLPNDYEEILGKHNCDWIYNEYKAYFDTFNYLR
jgi:sulfotransferase